MKRREFLTVPAAASAARCSTRWRASRSACRLKDGNGESAAAILHRRGSASGHGRLRAHFSERRQRSRRDRGRRGHLTSIASSPGPTAATSIATPKDRGSSPFPSTAIRAKKIPQEIYREGLKDLGDFASLSPDEQDEKLRAIETYALLPTAAHSHHRRHVLRPHARRQRRPDRLAIDRLSRARR